MSRCRLYRMQIAETFPDRHGKTFSELHPALKASPYPFLEFGRLKRMLPWPAARIWIFVSTVAL